MFAILSYMFGWSEFPSLIILQPPERPLVLGHGFSCHPFPPHCLSSPPLEAGRCQGAIAGGRGLHQSRRWGQLHSSIGGHDVPSWETCGEATRAREP
jgi:hypothetical protein